MDGRYNLQRRSNIIRIAVMVPPADPPAARRRDGVLAVVDEGRRGCSAGRP
jgi:hypothetical protein